MKHVIQTTALSIQVREMFYAWVPRLNIFLYMVTKQEGNAAAFLALFYPLQLFTMSLFT